MSFKKKDVYIKNEAEYESPDGEKYSCSIVKYGERCFIEWEKIVLDADGKSFGTDKTTIDIDMLKDLYVWYHESFNLIPANKSNSRLPSPDIQDFRYVEQAVKTSMDKYDDSVSPVESFTNWNSPKDAVEARTGIGLDSLHHANESPEDIKEIANIRKSQKIDIKSKGNSGKDFRRVNAGDLL